MNDDDYIKRMNKIGFIAISSVSVILIVGFIVYQLGYETASGIIMLSLTFVAILLAAYGHRSNKKQFALVSGEEQ